MKKTIKNIATIIFVSLIFYLLFSFTIWDLNAGNWGGGARYALVIISGLSAIIISSIYYTND